MPAIDLKHATIAIRDGSTSASAVTGALVNGTPTAGAQTMNIDGSTGIIGVGRTFTIAGETGSPVHTVTSHTETSGNTTTLVFTPPLATGGAADNSALTIPAVTGPNLLEIRIGQGNLTYTEARTIEYRLNRGLLDSVREGDQVPVDMSFDVEWWYLRSASGEPITPEEALKRTGNASAWTTTSADPCEPYAVDIVVTYHLSCGNVEDEIIVFQDFRWESLDHNLKDAQISVKGKCNITEAVVTRQAPVGSDILPPSMLSTADSAIANVGRVPLMDAIANVGVERQRTTARQLFDEAGV